MQKSTSRTRNFFWPVLVVAFGALLLALALEVFPPTVADLIKRAWPALLVLVGLAVLLDQIQPLRRYASLIALIMVVAAVAGTVTLAYSNRSSTQRSDNTVQFQQVLDADIERLHVIVRGLETSVEISPTVPDQEAIITAEFLGSLESVVEPEFSLGDDGVATFTLSETQPNSIPALETVGRGQMRIELPLGIPIALDFTTGTGTVSLNLLGLQVTRLDVAMDGGNLLLSLPVSAFERRGEVFLGRGDVTVFVPENVGLEVATNGREPQFAEGEYLVDPSSSAYLSRRFDDYDTTIMLNLTVGGDISLE